MEIPQTQQEALKMGFEVLGVFNTGCNYCDASDAFSDIITLGLKTSNTDFGYGQMEYFCEKCGKNQRV